MGNVKIHEIYVEKEQGVAITAGREDFDGDTKAWQESFFKLLSWKNTWSLCYDLTINSTYEHEPFVKVVANAVIKNELVEYMQKLGYRNLIVGDVWVGIGDIECDEDIDSWYFT